MVTRNVVLTDQQSELVERLVATGRYQNASEALRAGLRLLEREEVEIAALRSRLEFSLEQARSGDLADGDGEAAIRRAFATAQGRELMPKPWRLTRHAETALTAIARWTIETFGPHQAQAYEEDLILRCRSIADGTAQSQSCRIILDASLPEDLRFARAGQHIIVFLEAPEVVTILDFLHMRSDLPAKLAHLAKGCGH